ncbi:ion transporter [Chloroflexota bacterium]
MKKPLVESVIGILAILSIVVIVVEFLMDVSEAMLVVLYIIDLVICLVFAGEFIYRLKIAENRKRFLKTNSFEILAMIPAVALNALGSISIISAGLRSLRFIRVIRVILMIARMRRLMKTSGKFVRQSRLIALIGITVCIIFIGAFTVMILENDTADAQITNFSDAVWWSISTVTTVGYGDIVPHSIAGRIMGMLLMIIGIGVMATAISQVSATLVESRLEKSEKDKNLKDEITEKIKDGIDRIDTLTDNELSLLLQMIQSLKSSKKT